MQEQRHPHTQTYLLVFGALAILTLVTVFVSYLHLPISMAIFAALLIATFKAALVAAFFMHLKWERFLIYSLLGVTLFFMAVLFILPITDTAATADRRIHAEGTLSDTESHVP